MKLLVIGSQGQVARALGEAAGKGMSVVALGRPEVDLEQPETLERAIDAQRPDVVASVGAYTAVDLAESEPQRAHRINALGPEALAQACAIRNLPLLHVSTDFVFAGDKPAPYVETDPTGPQSVYGRTKLEGETRISAAWRRHVILRTAWVYAPEGKNFVRTMLRLAKTRPVVGVVADQVGCPTYAPDLAAALLGVAQRLMEEDSPRLYGVFHAAGDGEASWSSFAQAIFAASARRGGPHAEVNAIATKDYPTPAKRPANSRLDGTKLETIYGLRLRAWRPALEACMDKIAAGGFAVD